MICSGAAQDEAFQETNQEINQIIYFWYITEINTARTENKAGIFFLTCYVATFPIRKTLIMYK